MWIWKEIERQLINMEHLWKGKIACCGFTHVAKNVWVEKQGIFLFLGILTDERFFFVSSSFGRAKIDFDVGFIMRPTIFSLIDTPSLSILYVNMKICVFLIFCFVYP
jgi:hypothetical protein